MENIGFPFDFEDSYAHGKRLNFIKESIEEYCRKCNKSKDEIKILDVGCGTGIGITFPIASLGHPIIGVDIDNDSINYVQKENIYPNANFECGFLDKLTHLADFDIIICSEVLEHVPNPGEFLFTLKNRLNPAGIIILTVPNGYGWFEMEQFIYEKAGFKYIIKILTKFKIIPMRQEFLPLATLKKNNKHTQSFTYRKLILLFTKKNLGIIKSAKSTFFGGPISESLFWWWRPFLKFNNWLGDKLPYSLAVGWYFVLKNKHYETK